MSKSISHPLNTSLSKMQYSFTKASRFLPSLRSSCEIYYSVPDGKSKRSTSFGFGNKLNFSVDISGAPPPGTYAPERLFDKSPKSRGFSFGFGRDETVGGPLTHTKYLKQLPGPGTYQPIDLIDSRIITLKPRLPNNQVKRKSFIPGPGTYNPPPSINSNGRYVPSNYVNSKATKFSLSKSNSFCESKTPGPGTYPVQSGINKQGKYLQSKHLCSMTRSFGKSPRSSPTLKHLVGTPGPGSYKPFSQFETL